MHEDSELYCQATRRMEGGEGGTGKPPKTPLGQPVMSCYPALSARILADWRIHGHEGHLPSSAFRLQALYLDFGRKAPAHELAESILQALDDHRGPARASVTDCGPLGAEREAFGLRAPDVSAVAQRLVQLSRRALMSALVFNAHFWNVPLAIEVVGGGQCLERAALETCAFVGERRTGRMLGGDLRFYAPHRERREEFCSDHCLPAIGRRPCEDRPCFPPRTPADCGMLGILEGFRFFASFPEE